MGRSRNLQDLVRLPLLSSMWSATASLTVRTWPSALWWASITRESCHWLWGRSSLFLIRTTSPTHLFHQGLLHFCLCCRLIRYSFLHLIQNSLAKCCTHDHPQLLHHSSCRTVLPSNRSGATKLSEWQFYDRWKHCPGRPGIKDFLEQWFPIRVQFSRHRGHCHFRQ